MNLSEAELLDLIKGRKEHEHLEFKEGRTNYPREKLYGYCCAFANEGGGLLVLGVDDKRNIVGSNAFSSNLENIKLQLLNIFRFRVDTKVFSFENKRVLVFQFPSRPIGMPLKYNDTYLMRAGESLVSMPPNMLKTIFNEAEPDFTGEICKEASLSDLDEKAIDEFRQRWFKKTGNQQLLSSTRLQLLEDAELIRNDIPTYAALILFGTHKALGLYLPQAETIFEYRMNKGSIPYQERVGFREGFFLWHDKIWELINKHNFIQQYQVGLFRYDINTFDEQTIREGILNAVGHREYRLNGSIFIRQYPHHLIIESPGGFPNGITPENILDKQNPRNRRIAETFSKCGLIERSGQGADLMFSNAIKQSKPLPKYSKTDDYQVTLTIEGEIKDPRFLQFLEKIGSETLKDFSVHHLMVINKVFEEHRLLSSDLEYAKELVKNGIIEKGNGQYKFILSQRFYEFIGHTGEYTRRMGLSKNHNLELLLRHLENNKIKGGTFEDLQQVLPSVSPRSIRYYLGILKKAGKVKSTRGKSARWHII